MIRSVVASSFFPWPLPLQGLSRHAVPRVDHIPTTPNVLCYLKGRPRHHFSLPSTTIPKMASFSPPSPSTMIVFDFDGTITTGDTTAEIARRAMRWHSVNNLSSTFASPATILDAATSDKSFPSQSEPSPPESVESRWRKVVNGFLADLAAHAETYSPQQRTCVADEIRFLRSTAALDARSRERVMGAGLFYGVGEHELGAAVENEQGMSIEGGCGVALQPGWSELIHQLVGMERREEGAARGGSEEGRDGTEQVGDARQAAVNAEPQGGGRGIVAILSASWSTEFIRSVLAAHHTPPSVRAAVVANRVDGRRGRILGPLICGGSNSYVAGSNNNTNSHGDGGVDEDDGAPVIATSLDKRLALESMLAAGGCINETTATATRTRIEGEPKRHPAPQVLLYVGDSSTDLECLLAARYGLVIAQSEKSSALLKVLKRVGIKFIHVMEKEEELDSNGNAADVTIRWTRNFTELMESKFFNRLIAEWTRSSCSPSNEPK